MKKTITTNSGREIEFAIANKAMSATDIDLAEEVFAEGDQEPQAFYNNFCAAHLEKYGKEFAI